MWSVRRWILVGLLAGACAGAELRFDPSPSCSYRTDRAELPDGGAGSDVPPLERPVSIALGQRHACAAYGGGQVRCWGANDLGQLGPGVTLAPGRAHEHRGLPAAFAVCSGGAHSCSVTGEGVWCWGNDRYGQLGPLGDGTGAPVRAADSPLGPSPMSAGLLHTCLVSNLEVWCWGDNRFGQLGHDLGEMDREPRRVEGLPPVTFVAAGAFHTCAATADPLAPIRAGEVWCWGRDEHGELGDGEAGGWRSTPAPVAGLEDPAVVSAGPHHTCASHRDASWCWGRGARGELGQGRFEGSAVPVLSLLGGRATGGGDLSLRLSPGGELLWDDADGHSCLASHHVCWGNNDSGQLGDGTVTARSTPVPIEAPLRLRSISAGGASTCAIDWDHQLWCWGANDFGQLGLEGPGSPIPVRVLPQP